MSKVVLTLLIFGVALGFARHIHPHHVMRDGPWNTEKLEIDGMTIDMLRSASSKGFVPVNNIIFFRKQEPCDEGLKRDLFGICREVWDD